MWKQNCYGQRLPGFYARAQAKDKNTMNTCNQSILHQNIKKCKNAHCNQSVVFFNWLSCGGFCGGSCCWEVHTFPCCCCGCCARSCSERCGGAGGNADAASLLLFCAKGGIPNIPGYPIIIPSMGAPLPGEFMPNMGGPPWVVQHYMMFLWWAYQRALGL